MAVFPVTVTFNVSPTNTVIGCGLVVLTGCPETVMAPTFNHGAAEIYDARLTPSRNGAVTEALRLRPDARRSVHPTHPYAAIGPHADYLIALLNRFGPVYFELSDLLGLSPRVAGHLDSVKGGTTKKSAPRCGTLFESVDLRGLEPLTPCMPCRCATSCATAPIALAGEPTG